MSDYIREVIKERDEIEAKHTKLTLFVKGSEEFHKLSVAEQRDLKKQLYPMEAYLNILNRRLDRF
jgi:hypothetical protein